MSVPSNPDLYHIVHIDKLSSIISYGLLSDSLVTKGHHDGTVIGFSHIKQRRLTELTLSCYPDLYVGQCVPFYFCYRSIMLYIIYRGSAELEYRGGQGKVIHLKLNMKECIEWANNNSKKWAFTLSNAGSYYFEDRNNISNLNELDWNAINTTSWHQCKENKQAEFLIEDTVPWHLVEEIGVASQAMLNDVNTILVGQTHKPHVRIRPDWYY